MLFVAYSRRVNSGVRRLFVAKRMSAMNYRTKSVFIILTLIGAQWIDARSQETLASSECPVITVSCPDSEPDSPLTFKAQVSGVVLSGNLTFSWSVSAGVITSGQGTNSIKVDTSEASGQSVTATVEVNGLPDGCANKASCSTAVIRDPMATKIDEYGSISFQAEKIRLNRFAAELLNDSSEQGYILSYAGRRACVGRLSGGQNVQSVI
jgi:hypothetical protein